MKGSIMESRRRDFLVWSLAVGLTSYVGAKELRLFQTKFEGVEPTLAAVQEHLFPKGSQIPSAKEMKATKFLFETMMHASFDKDIRSFVIEGAKELDKRTDNKFAALSFERKEHALRAYEKTEYGSAWLSRIMVLTFEAIFSDPVYGSNIHQAGWKSINSYGGYPRPKIRYLEI